MMILNKLKDLWNGKVKLATVFWFYYLIANLFLTEVFIDDIDEYKDTFLYIILFLFYTYNLFIFKSLWSSARNYKGNKL